MAVKILIIEDEPSIADFIRRGLLLKGYEVESADTGIIWRVDSTGTLCVKWDNGISFDLDLKTDQWDVLLDDDYNE